LIGASENGWFQIKPSDLQPNYTTVDRDYLGTTVLSFNAPVTDTIVHLDMAARSVGVDLGAVYGVNKIELHPQATSTRVRAQDISVYSSSDNATTTGATVSDYVPVTGWTLTTNADGSLTINFPTIFQARYIKINTIWDDRDITNTSVPNYATFTNTASELVQVWALVTSQSQGYTYDAIGNRTSVTIDGATSTYTYYKNPQGGNLNWVRYDGTWYCQYDQAGNTVVKAKALLPGTLGSEPVDTSQEYWNYTWDLHNRLVNVMKNGQQLVAYTYDAENFRVQRTGTDGTTLYAYDRNAALTYQ
jgi:YD repeat-containing protein